MNYEQLVEEPREEMLQLVNTKCDALLQMYRSGEVHTNVKDTIQESCLITVPPAELKGKRPLAGVDYSSIKIRYMGKGQEQAKSIEHVPEQDEPAMLQSLQNMQL